MGKVTVKIMANVLNFAVENWWIILGGIGVFLFIIPTIFWGVAPFVAAVINYDDMEETIRYREYWDEIVRHEGFKCTDHGTWGNLWRFWLDNKIVRMMNILSLMFIWGYLLLLMGYSLGWFINLVFVKGLWGAVKAIGRGITKLYRAI